MLTNGMRLTVKILSVIVASLVTISAAGFGGWAVSQINGNKSAIVGNNTFSARVDERLKNVEADCDQISKDIRTLLEGVARIEVLAHAHTTQGPPI